MENNTNKDKNNIAEMDNFALKQKLKKLKNELKIVKMTGKNNPDKVHKAQVEVFKVARELFKRISKQTIKVINDAISNARTNLEEIKNLSESQKKLIIDQVRDAYIKNDELANGLIEFQSNFIGGEYIDTQSQDNEYYNKISEDLNLQADELEQVVKAYDPNINLSDELMNNLVNGIKKAS